MQLLVIPAVFNAELVKRNGRLLGARRDAKTRQGLGFRIAGNAGTATTKSTGDWNGRGETGKGSAQTETGAEAPVPAHLFRVAANQ